MGIDKLKQLMDLAFGGANLALTIDRDGDGKIEFTEIFAMLTSPLIIKIPVMLSGIKNVKAELVDLTAEELSELAEYCRSKDYFPEERDDLEDFIKDTLEWLAVNAEYVERTKAYFKS